jgi:hypothetical protein
VSQNSAKVSRVLICVTDADSGDIACCTLVSNVDVKTTRSNTYACVSTNGNVVTASRALKSQSTDSSIGIAGGEGVQSVVTKPRVIGSCR